MTPSRGICILILSTIASEVLSSHSSAVEEMDEKTKDAERAKANMNSPPPSEIDTALHIDSIIPDVLDHAPNYTARMLWTSGAQAKLGDKLSPEAIAKPPHLVSWHGNSSKTSHDDDYYFTILLTGPDHPSRETPNQREFLYWHQGNVPGSLYLQGKRDVIVEYLGPNPVNGTGEHRFVLFIYRQPSKIKFDEPIINETNYGDPWRILWNTRQFSKKYNLGDPHAVCYFFAEFEG